VLRDASGAGAKVGFMPTSVEGFSTIRPGQ